MIGFFAFVPIKSIGIKSEESFNFIETVKTGIC
ncbi:hypothetical protein BH11BAC3_BH11BAC3_20920 [soil metagenome]